MSTCSKAALGYGPAGHLAAADRGVRSYKKMPQLFFLSLALSPTLLSPCDVGVSTPCLSSAAVICLGNPPCSSTPKRALTSFFCSSGSVSPRFPKTSQLTANKSPRDSNPSTTRWICSEVIKMRHFGAMS